MGKYRNALAKRQRARRRAAALRRAGNAALLAGVAAFPAAGLLAWAYVAATLLGVP